MDNLRLRGEQARKVHHVCEGHTVPITDRSARTKVRTEKSTRNKKKNKTNRSLSLWEEQHLPPVLLVIPI